MEIINSFEIENEIFYFYDLNKLLSKYPKLGKLPKVLKILLEMNLKNVKDNKEFEEIINIFLNRNQEKIKFYPSRILIEEFEAFSTITDLASLRDIFKLKDKDLEKVNSEIMIDILLNNLSEDDLKKDYEQYEEKYSFMKWFENAFNNIRVIPFNSSINNEIDLNYLSTVLHINRKDEKFFLSPESVLSIKSDKNRANSFGLVNFSVDNIRAKAAIFGSEIFINLPKVIGVKIHGNVNENFDIKSLKQVLEEKLKNIDENKKVLEFYGNALKYLNIEDRKEILRLCSKYNISCSFFAIDEEIIQYLNKIKENEDYGKLIKSYLQKQGLLYQNNEQIDFDEIIDLDLNNLENSFLQKSLFEEKPSLNHISLDSFFKGSEFWQNLKFDKNNTYSWNENSTFLQPIKSKTFFNEEELESIDIQNAGILALFADDIKSEDISPLGKISLYSAAAKYLESKGIKSFEYNSFESRNINTEVMLRSIFDSVNIKNKMVSKEGGFSIDYRNAEIVSIFDKCQRFKEINRPLVIFAGENYGIGSFREWASKGISLLGIKAIIAKSFDERYKTNLIAFGVLPLEFIDDDIKSLNLKGNESITIKASEIKIDSKVDVIIHKENIDIEIKLKSRLDTKRELDFYKSTGLYSYFLKSIK